MMLYNEPGITRVSSEFQQSFWTVRHQPRLASALPRRGKDPPQLAERFLLLDDVVAKELSDLDYPWNLKDQMKPWGSTGDPE